MEYCSDFKEDLRVGQVAERQIAEMIENKSIEVKRDFKYQKTGNVFVEYACRGKYSGIITTESDFYAFKVTNHQTLFIKTDVLIQKCITKHNETGKVHKGGDDNRSRGILLTAKELLSE